MLLDLRKVTRNWVFGGLLAALGIGLGVFGIQSSFTTVVPSNAVATGKGVEISAEDYRKAFDAALEQVRTEQKRAITRQEAVDGGVAEQVLRELIGTKAIDRMAKKAGFAVSNKMVATAIRDRPMFKSQITGAFSREQYRDVLARNSLTEQEYENNIRSAITQRAWAMSLIAGLHTPESFAKLLYVYRTERRVISVAQVPVGAVPPSPEPTDDELKKFYNDHKVNLQTPELRTLTIVKARPELFLAKVEVPEDKIKQLYEFRKPTLTAAEKRSFVMIATRDQASANEAARRLAAGEEPRAIASALGGQVVPFSMVTKQGVPDPAVAEAVFALKKGQSSGAIQGKLAWSSAKIIDIAGAGSAPTYESQHDALYAELAKGEAQNALNDAVDKFDAARSGGKPLDAAAQEAGLDVLKVADVTAQGASAQSGPVAALITAPDLLKAAFLAARGIPTDFAPTPDGGYALVQVDAIKPAGVRPFEEVRKFLTDSWKAGKRGDWIRAKAEGVIKAVKGGQTFAAASAANGLSPVASSQMIDRDQMQNPAIAMLAQAAFASNENDVVMAPDARGSTLLVAQVEHVLREEPSRNPQLFLQARSAVDKMTTNDILLSMQNAAFSAAGVKTNKTLVDKALGVDKSDDSSAPAQ